MTKYLIAHIGHTTKSHEHIHWWKPEGRGYTFCIDKAGLYDEAEASSICRYGGCIAVPMSVVEPLARTTPYYRRRDGSLNKLYDGDKHRPVPNERSIWAALKQERLHCSARVYAPTPIAPSKARAIYLP